MVEKYGGTNQQFDMHISFYEEEVASVKEDHVLLNRDYTMILY